MKDCFIGIDQGSSSTKVLIMSAEGQMLFQTRRNLQPPFREGPRVEHNPLEILQTVERVLQESVQWAAASGFHPAGIGVSCQRSSCMAWDQATIEPRSPVISWRDTRGAEQAQSLAGQQEAIFSATGLPLTPYYAATKLRWLKENVAPSSTTIFGTLSSFLVQRLTKGPRAQIDHTHAARTQLMNIHHLAWDAALLEGFGLTGITLPEIVPTAHAFGTVQTPSGAVPLLASIGDQQAAMLGLGVLEKGDGGINYGTGGFLMANTGDVLTPAPGLMASVHYSTDQARSYLLEGSVNAVGDALEWVRSSLGLFGEYGEVDDLCWKAATDVVAFVGLNGIGAPHWENDISSSIHGLSSESGAADVVRGVVEGIAFFMKDIAEAVKDAGAAPTSFAVSGGVSSLSYLLQIQADILGAPLVLSAEQEVSALGAAFLAGMQHGTWTKNDVQKLIFRREPVQGEKNPGLERRYKRWQALHRMTGELDRE